MRLHPACRLTPPPVNGKFFASPAHLRAGEPSQNWQGTVRYFDCIEVPMTGGRPDWFYRPASGITAVASDRPWWESGDFDEALGDIKDIWEISRFNWVLAFAQRAAAGDDRSLARLNDWLTDWIAHNQPYTGYNWKCGQEAAIRVMHLAMAALILGQTTSALPGLRTLVRVHLARIGPTVAYAIAQDNNHGICEAAALFIGGAWLAAMDGDDAAREWMNRGRHQLEERVARLIANDGGFSMYSVMYHREFLDALSMAEIWCRTQGLPAFSTRYLDRVSLAARWLMACVHPQSGDAPNIGANDGTRLLPLTDTGYRDFRPAVQLACALFCDARAYPERGSWDHPMHWLGVAIPDAVLPVPRSRICPDSGFALLKSRQEDVQVFVRFPRYRFRPSHADPLHVDLWIGGQNILRGAGSYRYHAEPEWVGYFPSVASHNTVQFDDLDAMPRLGRFLFGDWLKLSTVPVFDEHSDNQRFVAGYLHGSGARHERKVSLRKGELEVCDIIAGFRKRAVVRWRLMPGPWKIEASGVSLDGLCLSVQSENGPLVIRLVEGWEARCYGSKTRLPVLEIEVTRPGCVTTRVQWDVT
ncbi:MAG: heparinase II/III-family protein [Thiobacillus sp.]|nr:heparinase II/III-family protein [Thiobacillus sp.]